ncbi:hypothetical protein STAL104432_10185 [Streptomyces albus]
MRAAARERGVELAGQRQVRGREHGDVVVHQRRGHGPFGHAVDVVDVALGRVGDPPLTVRQGAAGEFVLGPPGLGAQFEQRGLHDVEHRPVVGLDLRHQFVEARPPGVRGAAAQQDGTGLLDHFGHLAEQTFVHPGSAGYGHGSSLRRESFANVAALCPARGPAA